MKEHAYQGLEISSHVRGDCDCRDLCDFENGLGPARREWSASGGETILGMIQAKLVLGSGRSAKLREG